MQKILDRTPTVFPYTLDVRRESLFKRPPSPEAMRSSTKYNIWAVLLTALMLASLIPQPTEMSDESAPLEAGRQQGGVEAACEGLTFEDMFNYTHATFDVQMNDDWESAYVQAIAWINGTLADQVRLDLEGLFEGIPGGNNGWLSSDEYQAIDSIAAECVTQTNPRIGFRGGPPHRGGDGVNWYNATWENTDETPLTVEEWNLMPQNHVDEQPCEDGSPNADCVEIPNIPLSPGRNCDTTINDPDECRIIVYLNGTFVFEGLTLCEGCLSNDEFTMAMNTSNMTNADLAWTYPALEGLRVDVFEECDGRSIDYEHNDNQGDAPVPGTCESDETISYETRLVSIDGETRLRVETHVEYDMSTWPVGQDMFFDMTTEPPDVDDPPMWTEAAPSEGNIMPIADDGVSHFVSTAQMDVWATDDQGAPLISCTGAEGWSMTSDGDGLSADAPAGIDSTTVTCKATDASNQSTDERNYTLQVPMRLSGTASGGVATVTMTPTAGMPSMDAVVTLVQDDSQTSSDSVTMNGETVVSVDLSSMSPGPFMVRISADGTGMANFDHTYDFGMSKASSPPSITVSDGFWNGETYELSGFVNDPDGDPVAITGTNDDFDWGTFQVQGNNWVASGAGVPGAVDNMLTITACDRWDQCTSIMHSAGETPSGEDDEPVNPPVSDSEGSDDGLAVAGFIIAIVALVIIIIAVVAMVLLGRRK